ncbi:flagellar motor protein MotB [Sphingobium boeckii]|uniref:Chemotaxis protein MotB n=1 Tax=Sphingobium boeckii TaxID=1082345 RepID=A0A7W9EEP5_9SPHN|nr:flagellar motor protein MotB [Sphingobium boeckii]MBB5686478.1 chemotaxis protein MotB [Sphingobium boeckii]
MAKAPAKRGKNEPEVRPIIVKKIIAGDHGGHHGGAWKVAYADFVTAMMAFFLLLWILGATTEKQRKGIADYFTPTLIEMRQKSAGSNGAFGGQSIVSRDNYAHKAAQTGSKGITMPKDATGGNKDGAGEKRMRERKRFQMLRKELTERMKRDKKLSRLLKNVRFTETREGLRIDLIDEADFSMFSLGTATLLPEARRLLGEVARVIDGIPNNVIVRGHTDALPYASGRSGNNWTLSAARAESTRLALNSSGVIPQRFARIEGVAEREPYVPGNIYDPRNRRMSVTLAWISDSANMDADPAAPVEPQAAPQKIASK